jgi:hypothetical protein
MMMPAAIASAAKLAMVRMCNLTTARRIRR